MTTILGPDGRPMTLAQETLREPQTASVGWLQREFEEHPARGLTPARLAQIMATAERGDILGQLDLADDMEERDAHLYAEMGKRRGAITGLAWDVQPPDEADKAAEDLCAQVKEWLTEIRVVATEGAGGMAVLVRTMTDAMLKGFSAQEMVWDYTPDGAGRKVLLPRLEWQPQRWFTLSADRRRLLLRSRQMTEGTADLPAVMGEELLPYAWLMHIHPARNGYLSRMALARVLFWPYLFKHYAVRDLAEFLEIYGLPLRLGKYPAGASDAEKRALLRAVSEIGHNAAGIIPQSMLLEFQSAAAGTEVPFAAMWDRMDAAQSKAILGQTLTASEGQHGTQALGKVHNDVRMDIRSDDAACIADSITRQLIRPLVLLNVPGVDPRSLPEDVQAYADALPKLAGVGMQIPLSWAHERLRIPKPEDGEPVLRAPAAPAAPARPEQEQGGEKAPLPAARQQRAATTALVAGAQGSDPGPGPGPAPDLIDELIDDELQAWRPLMAPMVQPLLDELDRAVAQGESLDAFRARLPEMLVRMDFTALGDSLARAAFSARLAGEAQLDLGPAE
jgi:phage gp29-like protein